jgi:hypothetical protein
MNRRLLLFAGLLASLAACTHELHVAVSDTRAAKPKFALSPSEDGIVQDMPVNELRVVPDDGGEWDYRHPAWCVALEAGTYLELAEVRYGELPVGFTPCAKAQPLQPGHRYLVSVSGAGVVAHAEFRAGR